MGLAASQARFLAITARKMNCEFQSMQIAQEKLSTTRDLQRAATEYQNSLDATKLVWDTQDGDTYELSYDLMMRPSTLNNFTPYLITDTRGKVVLSQKMFEAAQKAGIIDKNGDPTFRRSYTDIYGNSRTNSNYNPTMGDDSSTNDGTRNAFLYQLGLLNQLNGSMVTEIKNLGESGYNASGIGGPIFDKTTANAMQTNIFINYMKSCIGEDILEIKNNYQFGYNVVNESNTGYMYSPTDANTTGTSINIQVYKYSAGEKIDRDIYCEYPAGTTAEKVGSINGTTYRVGDTLPTNANYKKGEIAPVGFTVAVKTDAQASGLTYAIGNAISNIFTDNNNAVSTAGENLTDNKFAITKSGKSLSNIDLQSLTLGDILTGQYELTYNGTDAQTKFESVLEKFAKLLGYDNLTHIVGLNVDTESNEALNLAYTYTKQLLSADNTTLESTTDPATLYTKARQNTNIIKSSKNNMSSISLTNLVSSFLTNFARAIDGLSTSFYVDDKSVKKSNLVTNDYSYYFVIANEGSMKDEIELNADFYNMLYNVIATTGACTDEMLMNKATENSMLHEAIKNGRLFVSSLNTDGYFYQGAYTLTNRIAEVPDEDAIARAEREYEVTKSKLNTKEETLELKMKNLDMEISTLTTEFDTVKNLISKGVEKVFTMFST